MTGQSIDLSRLYKPHSGQQAVHDSDAKVKVLEVGRRWGKSRCALWEMMRRYLEALEIPADPSLIPGFHAWVVCPSYPQSRQVWNELMSFWPKELIEPSGGVRQDDKLMHVRGSDTRNWGLIEVKSAHDPDALQTAGLDFLWITEAQDIDDRAFERLLPTLRSPGRQSYGIYEGIPSTHSNHWFKKVYESAADGREGYLAYHATTFENELIDDFMRGEIEQDREILPDRVWRRMYLAEFNEDAGFFSNIAACAFGDELPEPVPGREYVAGLDLGRKIDPSVLTIMDAEDRRVVHHISFDTGTEWVGQRTGVVRAFERWGFSRLVLDATGIGDIFMSELLEEGLPVEPFVISAASRESLLQGLSVGMERNTLSFPPIAPLLRQLRAFQYIRQAGGAYKAEAPPGEHDDEVFALALALTACAPPPGLTGRDNHLRPGRYVPTQNEANSGARGNGPGARLMRQRRLSRVIERQDKAGIR